ncbi:ADP,ATP carrier protein 1 [Chlamydiales bacterium SCGC AB-751-O23]|jgi:ATP:ADP antiporter, AAA family|nr:ADP,ATP carrier protein 1 [Chlamydiales bacterium SCGC AB-751-O23]
MPTDEKEFSTLRSIFWPIHRHELRRFVPMGVMMFFILFNFSVLRDSKDALVMTAKGAGAEVLPLLKVGGVIPFAFLTFFIYLKLSNIVRRQTLFYLSILPFVLFFIIFDLYLFPNRELLHLDTLADFLERLLPKNSGLIPAVSFIRNWTFSLYYIVAELWGSVVISLLFWGFANDVTTTSEAKRFYVLFPMISNFALIMSSFSVIYYAKQSDALGQALDSLIFWVVASALVIIALYWWMNKSLFKERLKHQGLSHEPGKADGKKEKLKLSLRESLKLILTSRYLGSIAFIVVAYGLCIHVVEVLWKAQMQLMFPKQTDYLKAQGYYTLAIGLINFPMMLVGTNVIRRMGWKKAAYATPLILGTTGAVFFGLLIFQGDLEILASNWKISVLSILVTTGAIQGILSKSTKYTLFDATKEMALIPLDQEEKVKGKAAIDVVASRFGKFGGGVLVLGMLSIWTLQSIPIYAGILVLSIIGIWFLSLNFIDKRFSVLTEKLKKEEENLERLEEHI